MYIGGHFITQIALRIFLKLKTLVKGFFEYILPKACGSTSGSGRGWFTANGSKNRFHNNILLFTPSNGGYNETI